MKPTSSTPALSQDDIELIYDALGWGLASSVIFAESLGRKEADDEVCQKISAAKAIIGKMLPGDE